MLHQRDAVGDALGDDHPFRICQQEVFVIRVAVVYGGGNVFVRTVVMNGLLNSWIQKTENGRIRKGHLRKPRLPPTVASQSRVENIETENWERCARRRKSAKTEQKRQNPAGINPQGLALNKSL